jgi:hypothetical protein
MSSNQGMTSSDAEKAGAVAFAEGRLWAPSLNQSFLEMASASSIDTADLLDAYSEGWASASHAALENEPAGASEPSIIKSGALTKQLIKLIRALVQSVAVAGACEWLESKGYASDEEHARELINTALYA